MNYKPHMYKDLTPAETVEEILNSAQLLEDWGVPRDVIPDVIPIMSKCLDMLQVPKGQRVELTNLETALEMAVAEYLLNRQGYTLKKWNNILWHQAYRMGLGIEKKRRFEGHKKYKWNMDDEWERENYLANGTVQEL